jgi:starch synthase
MRILLASSELYPYSKTGGLADMVGSLSKRLASSGHQVGVVTPLYLGIREQFPQIQRLNMRLDFPLGNKSAQGEVWTLEPAVGLTVYFVDQAGFYQRESLYQKYGVDYPDNAERFIFFAKSVAHLARHLEWKPQVVHAHDWQSACAVLFIQHQKKAGWQDAPRTCMTIHNLAYQGVFSAGHFALTNLPWEYFTPNGVEFYAQFSSLKAGIAYADVITTVSPRYAREITTEEFGCGLAGLLRQRQGVLRGILNGVDYEEWDPGRDPHIAQPYSVENVDAKLVDKIELQKELGLIPDPSIALFGSITRLVEQKGVDIMLGALDEMLGANLQFVMLGTGETKFEKAFQDLAKRYASKAAVKIAFEESLSHRVEAGCDFFLMPSQFEPCGLNQMYSLRYGTVPVVRRTGGLDDTVIDVRDNADTANGIKFDDYSAAALAKGIRKALALYEQPEVLAHFRRNGMTADFSWERTEGEYLEVYRQALDAKPA